MTNAERSDSYQIIPKDTFNICLVDNVSLKDICKMYTKNDLKKTSVYALDKFSHYLREKHNLSIKEYTIKYLNFAWPKCPVKEIDVGFNITGQGLIISRFAQGGVSRELMPKLDMAYKKFSEERKGEGNPMFGRESWAKGLTKDTNESLRMRAEESRGRKTSDETKQKQRKARKNHPLKARHVAPHSLETREKLRESTARLWAEGVFNRTTSIHIKTREFLQTLELAESVQEEFQVKYFSMDFAFPLAKVAIECQGSYYHVDPRIYPNGPINAIQRRNFGRDKAKKKVCCDQQGWKIIEIWEPEINNGTFKEYLKCKLKELNLLKN
jgi:hypothetical protein